MELDTSANMHIVHEAKLSRVCSSSSCAINHEYNGSPFYPNVNVIAKTIHGVGRFLK